MRRKQSSPESALGADRVLRWRVEILAVNERQSENLIKVTGSKIQEPRTAVKSAAGESTDLAGLSWGKKLSVDLGRAQRKIVPWAMKGGLALFDQAIFAGSNFVISILLARWLSAEQYGTFAVAFAVFLFLVNFHQALLLEPMLVFGSSVYRNCLRRYLKGLLAIHLGMSLLFVFGLLVSAAVAFRLGQADGLPGALVGLAFSTPTVLLLWLTKRTFYLKLSPAPSAAAALLYCALTMGGLAFVYKHHLLSPLSAFLLMGLGGLGASFVLIAYLASRLTSTEDGPSVMDTWGRHWRYGRWALGANAMMWIPINAFYPLVSKFSGLAQAGELKALMNFASPMLQTCAALSSLMLPYAARVMAERGGTGVNVILKRMTLLCVACAVPYWIVLLVFKGPAFRMLYSGRYTEVAYLLPVVALASVAGSAFFGPSIVLRSLEAPRLVFAAVSISSGISVAIGVPLTRALGVAGAVWSIALSEALAFVAAVVLLRRKARRSVEALPALMVLPAAD
jgi:O-antigen/teichoic acid export membrane protein